MSYLYAQRGQQKTDTKMWTCELHKYAQMRAYLILDTVLQSTHFQPLLLLLLAEEKKCIVGYIAESILDKNEWRTCTSGDLDRTWQSLHTWNSNWAETDDGF